MLLRTTTLAAAALAALPLAVMPAAAQDSVKVGFISFLTGPAAGPFGIPGKQGAELMVKAVNEGSVPAPYNTVGLGGRLIEPTYVDEAGGSAAVVTEYRNLVQRTDVDSVVGFISSGNCLAGAPVAEELKTFTILYDCGTPRIFEDNDFTYVFRVSGHATQDNVAAARYMIDQLGQIPSVAGVNQNYAWGQDSWRDFTLALQTLAPDMDISRELFPKLFAGEYGAEISSVLSSRSPAVHTSLWGGDLESFTLQSVARGLTRSSTMLQVAGESAMFRLASQMPEGTMIGSRGTHGLMAPDTTLANWFRDSYVEMFGEMPTYPSYHMAQSIIALKYAWDKATEANGGAIPNDEQLADALRGATFEATSGTIEMALGNGHQGIADIAYGTFALVDGEPAVENVIIYPARCVNPPANMKSVEWLEAGMPGAQEHC
ncbi:MAG: ABC transporter substrate-binding protein [Pseudomonadota bacterium]